MKFSMVEIRIIKMTFIFSQIVLGGQILSVLFAVYLLDLHCVRYFFVNKGHNHWSINDMQNFDDN